jgi:hypothetical protein
LQIITDICAKLDRVEQTKKQYQVVMTGCREVFRKKMEDYGSSWRILRLPSLTDQLFIKARRIRSIQEKQVNKVGEQVDGEFIALVNYSLMALIQIDRNVAAEPDLDPETALGLYDQKAEEIRDLMFAKNHDYGEAWRDMRISSMTDLILVKLYRIKQIEDNDGKTMISEGIGPNLMDIANYSLFCLILLNESMEKTKTNQ